MLLYSLDDAGMWTNVAQIVGAVLAIYLFLTWLAAILWVANDVRMRTHSPAFQVGAIAMVTFLFLPGLLLYIALRPQETLATRMERAMEYDLYYQGARSPTCANCARRIESDYVRCPYCAWQVGSTCESCERVLVAEWVACPYCGAREERRTLPVAQAGASPPARTSTAPARTQPRTVRPAQPAAHATNGLHPSG
jgi:hypothetical protein